MFQFEPSKYTFEQSRCVARTPSQPGDEPPTRHPKIYPFFGVFFLSNCFGYKMKRMLNWWIHDIGAKVTSNLNILETVACYRLCAREILGHVLCAIRLFN